ncbi:MAG: hypothetical protein MZV70_51390 [Desulfobacterales bacterium]|nr:hypothetical protein [Desulfobacterales bacterium]
MGGKSPLTGGIKESNSGGQASQVLARLGYAAIILEGKPKENDLYKVFINKDGVKISRGQQPEDARQLRPRREDERRVRRQDRLHLHRAGRRDEDVRRHGGLHGHGAQAHPPRGPRRRWRRHGLQGGQGDRP